MDETEETKGPNLWLWSIILCVVVAAIVSLTSAFTGFHWISNLWFNYGYASDKGNGGEALQQTVIYFLIAAIFVPVVRKAIRKELNKLHAHIHEGQEEIHQHLHHIGKALNLEPFERKPKEPPAKT